MTRILNRQRQLAEQGRIRLGVTTTASNGKVRPVASKTFVLTSHSREHIEKAAELWGGQVQEWTPQGNGAQQWRVITEASVIDAILPPGDPLSQAYEMWNRGGCVRRCDGVTEQFSGSPCLCVAQFGDDWHEQRQGTVCDSKSRLKVLLADMPGLGSWRLETGSFYATDEIAGMVDVIRGAVGDTVMVPVRLRIEPRSRVAGGKTKQFVVPVLELRGVTAGALVSGAYGGIAQVEAGRRQPAAIAAGPAPDFLAEVQAADSVDAVRVLWLSVKEAGAITQEFKAAANRRVEQLTKPSTVEEPAAESVELDDAVLWQSILAVAGERGMSAKVLADDFAQWSGGVLVEDADGLAFSQYLDHLKAEAVA